MPTLGAVFLLNGIAPGTGASQRIGKKIILRNLLIRCSIGSGNTGANVFRGMVRVLAVYDKQTNATAPTVADILEYQQGVSPMNMNNRDRFVVLFTKQYALDQAGGHQSAQMLLYKKLNLQTFLS